MKEQKKAAPPRMGAPAKTVEAYLAAVPEDTRAALEKLRRQIRALLPGSTEQISYGMPMVRHNGRMLVAYAARKGGGSFYGLSASLLGPMSAEIEAMGFALGGKGTVHFTAKKPLPAALVKRLVKARLAQVEAEQPARKAKAAPARAKAGAKPRR